jgi:bis(5'-nucleosidyl)-tetraphosphatase
MLEDTSYGIIVVLRSSEVKYLLLRQTDGHWSFPKGHKEGNETDKEAALRELHEESGIQDVEFLDVPPLYERYSFSKNGETYNKTVTYFIAFAKSENVVIQEKEVIEYIWATHAQAQETFTFKEPKEILTRVRSYLDPNGLSKELGYINGNNATLETISQLRRRYVARAIVVTDDGMIVLPYSSFYDLYVLPGGGIDEGETIEEGAIRECKEETGYRVELIKPLGNIPCVAVTGNDPRITISFGYLAKTVGEQTELSLMEDEQKLGISVNSYSYSETMRILKENFDKNKSTFAQRSIIFLEQLTDEDLVRYGIKK